MEIKVMNMLRKRVRVPTDNITFPLFFVHHTATYVNIELSDNFPRLKEFCLSFACQNEGALNLHKAGEKSRDYTTKTQDARYQAARVSRKIKIDTDVCLQIVLLLHTKAFSKAFTCNLYHFGIVERCVCKY